MAITLVGRWCKGVGIAGLVLALWGCGSTRAPVTASAAAPSQALAPAPKPASVPGAQAARVVPSEQLSKRAQEESKSLADARAASISAAAAAAAAKPAVSKTQGPAIPNGPAVWLYVSLTSQEYFMKAGLDGSVRTLVWENFLRKYKIPYVRTTTVELLEQVPGHSVLLIPSTPALSAREWAAVRAARERGVSVLSTWLTGVRNETGDWQGFDTMEKTLGARVAGNTEDSDDDGFMIVHGDNPVLHALAAGQRVWIDHKVKDFWPLRLVGKNYAAQIMTWGRTFSAEKQTGMIVFDEIKGAAGIHSRNVVFGFPEQVWLSSEPKHMEAIAYNTLGWLLRQPDAYLSAWPHPYQSGFVMAVEGGEDLGEVDLEFAKQLEAVGARGSYYLLSSSLERIAPMAKKIQRRGHELAFFGDKFEAYKGQSAEVQAKRLDSVPKVWEDVSIKLPAHPGFVAPMYSYDDTTYQLLLERGVGYYAGLMDATEARLPFFAKGTTDVNTGTVVLPLTQPGPEEATEEGDPDEGMQYFLKHLSLSDAMGGLSWVRIPTQTILAQEHQDLMFEHLKSRKGKMWMTTASDVTQWWRERAKIDARLEFEGERALLIVTVYGNQALKNPARVLVNLPKVGSRLRLQSPQADNPTPPVAAVDAWRSAVLLEDLDPGEYHWYLQFDAPGASSK